MKPCQKLTIVFVCFSFFINGYSDIEKHEKIEKTFVFQKPGGDRKLVVDNVFGSIQVTGYSGEEVQVSIEKTVSAKSEKKLQQALQDVALDIIEEDSFIELYVDGPFRERHGQGIRWRGYQRSGYKVTYDFVIRVPQNVHIELKTVNEGDIVVRDVYGDFKVNNVNGSIKMDRLQGSGDVYTVNGDVSLDFQKNPQDDSCFGSLNGDVHLYFQPRLSADFYLETFNGDFFTDFPVKDLPKSPFVEIEKNGKTVYKAGHRCGVRAGEGGPEIELNGFNGDMYILKK